MPTWTSPRTWVDGELLGATIFNAHVRDNLNALMNPNNFTLYDATHAFSTTATTLVTLTSTALVIQGGGPAQFGAIIPITMAVGTHALQLVLDIDGSQINLFSGSFANPNYMYPVVLVTGLSVASHTIAWKWRVDAATTTAYISAGATPVSFYGIEL